MSEHPRDECECGDARESHADGVGKCAFNRNGGGVGHHGAPDCDRFRLAFPHEGPGSREAFRLQREADGTKPS
jgi:hypothetical protein